MPCAWVCLGQKAPWSFLHEEPTGLLCSTVEAEASKPLTCFSWLAAASLLLTLGPAPERTREVVSSRLTNLVELAT